MFSMFRVHSGTSSNKDLNNIKFALFSDLQKNKPTGFSLPSDLIQKIDEERGDIPRSRFLLRILEKVYLTTERKGEVAVVE
jgi:hypothetical protein